MTGGMQRPVIWFSIFDWWTSSHGHSDFQLALRLAATRPVLFVNTIGLRVPRLGKTERVWRRVMRKVRSAAHGLARPVDNLTGFSVLSLVAPPVFNGFGGGVALHAAIAQVRFALSLRAMLDPVCVVTVPTALPLAESLSPGRIIYYRSDDHSAFAEANPAVASLERRLLAEAQVVLYAARHLMAREIERTGDRAFHLEHAVDPAVFHPGVAPDTAIAGLPAPRIGFFGALRGHAVDFDLLGRVADRIAPGSLVLMGDRSDHLGDLAARPNVHLLAPRPHAAMPSCWSALSAAILPYRQTAWTWGIDPIKLREAMAMGLPILGTAIPATVAHADRVDIVDPAKDFGEALASALSRPRPVETTGAAIPTWSDRATALAQIIDRM